MDLLAKQRQGRSLEILKCSYASIISKFSKFINGKVILPRPRMMNGTRTWSCIVPHLVVFLLIFDSSDYV